MLAAKTLVVLFEVKPVHSLPVRCVDVVLDAEVDTHTVACIQGVYVGFLGQVGVVGFQTEADEPLSGSFLLERDFFDVGVVRNRT